MNTSSTITQKRGKTTPASSGGSFRSDENSAPESSLVALSPAAEERAEVAEAYAFIEQQARKYAIRYRYSDDIRDEITQDIAVDLIAQQKFTGLDSTHRKKLVHHAAKAVAQRAIDSRVHHYDLTARALLKKRVRDIEAYEQRDLTSHEVKAIAEDIWENDFKPGNRPDKSFYLENRESSINRPLNGEGSEMTFGDTLVHQELDAPYAGDDTQVADLVDGLSLKVGETMFDADGREIARRTPGEVRKAAWNHIAELSDTPAAIAGHLSKEEGKVLKAQFAKYPGGAAALGRAWENGDTTETEDRILFAPFGELGIKQQEQVVSQLLRKPDYADELWTSAATFASEPAAA